LNRFDLHDPQQWIRFDIAIPPPATPQELQVAADVRWLYMQRSEQTPGYKRVASVLRELLLQRRGYIGSEGRLKHEAVLRDINSKIGPALARLDPLCLASASEHCLLPVCVRVPLQRYSFFAQLVGLKLQEVFAIALTQHPEGPEGSQFKVDLHNSPEDGLLL
jgi:hypothetical protein